MDFASILTISLNFEKNDRENDFSLNSGTFVSKKGCCDIPKVFVKASETSLQLKLPVLVVGKEGRRHL